MPESIERTSSFRTLTESEKNLAEACVKEVSKMVQQTHHWQEIQSYSEVEREFLLKRVTLSLLLKAEEKGITVDLSPQAGSLFSSFKSLVKPQSRQNPLSVFLPYAQDGTNVADVPIERIQELQAKADTIAANLITRYKQAA